MFEKYDIEQRKAIIALLFKLAKSDNSVSNIEKLYLRDIASSIGVDSFSIDEVLKNPEAYPLEAPLDERERMTILYYLLFMMRVDGRIEKGEEKLIYEASFRLGFNEKLTEDLIGVMKTYLHEEVPPSVMLTQIKKHLN
ncbi:MAG: hypothetical protein AB8F94_21950 [Saprospiraceae bacterium]